MTLNKKDIGLPYYYDLTYHYHYRRMFVCWAFYRVLTLKRPLKKSMEFGCAFHLKSTKVSKKQISLQKTP